MITIIAKKRMSIFGTTYYDMIRDDGIYYGSTTSPYEWARNMLVKGTYKLITTTHQDS